MSESQNRKANRVYFKAPARICAAYGIFEAAIEDISWVGIRLRMKREDLELKPGAGIGAAAACVRHLLGTDFSASLDSAHANSGVLKRVNLVRLSLPDREDDAIDLGCTFEKRLTDREARALDLTLPPDLPRTGRVRRHTQFQERDTQRVDLQAQKGPANEEALFDPEHRDQVYVPRKPFRAVLTQSGGGGPEPLVCATESFTANTVLVRARGEMFSFGEPRRRRDAAGAAMLFTERYGERIDLELVEGSCRVWQGVTHVCSVEVDPQRSRDILLRLAFGRPLQEAELARLRSNSHLPRTGT